MAEIGATLREARMRAHIDVSEIEAQTKIRAKYLRALENEEWDLLPGPTYVTSFLRTYARALGLDSKALLEEYRKSNERANEPELQPILQTPRRSRSNEPPPRSRLRIIFFAAMAIVVILLIVNFLIRPGGKKNHGKTTGSNVTITTSTTSTVSSHTVTTTRTGHPKAPLGQVISLQIIPTAAVYVCLVNRKQKELIPGLVLQPGSPTRTFHSRHFYLELANSAVKLRIDGTDRSVPHSSQPIGYSITKMGRHRVPVAHLPTCG